MGGRYKEFMSFIMIDLVGFKRLNDCYGHQAGDDILIEVANLLRGYHGAKAWTGPFVPVWSG